MGVKIVVIGAASSYTPELFDNLAHEFKHLDVAQVTLTDLNAEKLEFVAGVCRRLIAAEGLKIRLETTTDLEAGLQGADFVMAQIRVGGLAARVRDETLPVEFGMVGNETTGPGGFISALRVLPAMLDIARKVERIAPQAWILNMSNPAGIVTEAILKHTKVRALGFCNIPINTTYAMAHLLDVDPARVTLDSFGLNHLSWVRRVLVDGEDRLAALMDQARDGSRELYDHGLIEEHVDPEWLQTVRMIPSWYVRYYTYPEIVIEEDRRVQHTKGTDDMHAEEALRRIYTESGWGDASRKILAEKGGAQYYLPVLQALDSIVHDRGDVVIVDTLNGSATPDLPSDACIEVPARIFRERAEPLAVGQMPLTVRGLVQTVKAYEQLTIEAAVTGSRKAAVAALMANPLVGTYPRARAFFDRALENERQFLHPGFYANGES